MEPLIHELLVKNTRRILNVYETTTGTPTGTPLCQIFLNTHAQFRGNPKFSFSRCGHSVTTTEKDGVTKWGKNQFSQL